MKMYAIIELGARQYNVTKGDIIEVEKQEIPENKEFNLDRVLLVAKGKEVKIGQPYLKEEAKVSAVLLAQIKGEKKVSFKYRRRKSSHWSKGHRQQLSCIKIKEIDFA